MRKGSLANLLSQCWSKVCFKNKDNTVALLIRGFSNRCCASQSSLEYWSHRKLNAQPTRSRGESQIKFPNLGKAALAVLHGVLHGAHTPSMKLSMDQIGIQPILKLLPVLGTSLDEYDTSSREISLRYVTSYFNLNLLLLGLASG